MKINTKKRIKKYLTISLCFSIFLIFFQLIQLYPGYFFQLKEYYKKSDSPNIEINYPVLNNKQTKTIFVEGEKDKPLLILFHGNFELVDKYPLFLNDLSKQHGLNSVLIEYNGYGDAKGFPSLSSTTKSVKEWVDNNNIGNGEIIVFGYSIGTGHALHFTQKHPELVDHVILQAGFMSPINAISRFDAVEDVLSPLMIDNYEADWKIDSISKKGYLQTATILHGKNDKLFNVKQGQRLSAQFELNGVDTYYIEFDGGHSSFNYDKNKVIENILNK